MERKLQDGEQARGIVTSSGDELLENNINNRRK